VNFGQAIKSVFSKYAVFEGKATRPEYWWWFLFSFIVITVLWLLFLITGGASFLAGISEVTDVSILLLGGFAWVILQLAYLALAIPSLAVLVRRLHDTGRSGWYLLLFLIPIAGPITMFVITLQPSKTEV